MTTKGKLEKMLFERGLFLDEAKEIVENAIPVIENLCPQYKITWGSPASEYPETLYRIMFISVETAALEWIKKNKPNAWYRPQFE